LSLKCFFNKLLETRLALRMSAVITYYLEMRKKAQICVKEPMDGLDIVPCEIKEYSYNRFLYQLVGQQWQWTDKLTWTDDNWKFFVEDPTLHT